MKVLQPTLALLIAQVASWEDTCKPMKEIYADGTQLCEKMWADSFEVVDSETDAFTFWFFDTNNNPNDKVARKLFGDDVANVEECHLQYFHKDVPGPEDTMTECHPWKNRACCDSATVPSAQALNNAYGDGYRWNRCGQMSQACERFFVQEACFYECEPAAGLFRKFNDSQSEHPDYNEWQLHKMPIQKSMCDAWYDACANDYFCGGGDFFECQAYWEEQQAGGGGDDDNQGLVIGMSIAGAVAALGVAFALFMVAREKKGKPVFAPAANEAAVSS